MTHVVVLGAGIGGIPMAYELREKLASNDRLTVVGNGPDFHFVPSNMIETMVSATANNIRAAIDGRQPSTRATWNAICLADMGDTGIAFVAQPQIPPRNVNWFGEGRWVHLAKIGLEKYFIRKMKKGTTEPIYEKYVLSALGIEKLKKPEKVDA